MASTRTTAISRLLSIYQNGNGIENGSSNGSKWLMAINNQAAAWQHQRGGNAA